MRNHFLRAAAGNSGSGLLLHLDAGDSSSYSGSGNTWYDLSPNGDNWTFNNVWTHNSSEGSFTVNSSGNYVGRSSVNYSGVTDGTVVFWFRTTDTVSMFIHDTTNSYDDFLGAYYSSNKYYNSTGTPSLFKNKSSIPNLYDYIRTGSWMMLEFKGVNMAYYGSIYVNGYLSTGFRWDTSTRIGIIQIYDHVLTDAESSANYDLYKGRYGLS